MTWRVLRIRRNHAIHVNVDRHVRRGAYVSRMSSCSYLRATASCKDAVRVRFVTPSPPTPAIMLQVQVSIRRIQYEKAWSKVEEMQTEDVVFEGPIIAVNRGGAIVLVEVRLGCCWS